MANQIRIRGDIVSTNDLTVTEDLQVDGTSTTLNTATLDVEDNNITINNGGNQASAANAGITVEISDGTDAKILYDNATTSKFKCGNSGSESEIVTIGATQTLTNKTLTSAVLNTGVSGTAIVDEDDMASNSATKVPTQQSVKAYVDAAVGDPAPIGVRSVTTTDTATNADDVLLLSGASFTQTLFTAVGNSGKQLWIKHAGTSFSQTYTVDGNSSETIDGAATVLLHTNGEMIHIVSDGSNWILLERRIQSKWESVTVTGSWSTNTTYTAFLKRVGDTAFYDITVATSGAPTSANLTVTLNNSLTIDTAKISQTAAGIAPRGTLLVRDAGTKTVGGAVVYNSSTTVQAYWYNPATYVVTNPVAHNDPMTFASGDSVNMTFQVPISGWNA